MKNRGLNSVILFVIFTMVGCATAVSLTQIWKDQNLQPGTIKKMMVVGIAKEPDQRQRLEDEFARHLTAHGVTTIKSYEIMTLAELNDKKGGAEMMRDMNVDAVLVTRLIDKKMVDTHYPPTYHDDGPRTFYGVWAAYYGMAYMYLSSPGYTVSKENAKLETNIYSTKTEKLAWSMLPDTWIEKADKNRLVLDVIGNDVVDRMTKDGVIPAKEKK